MRQTVDPSRGLRRDSLGLPALIFCIATARDAVRYRTLGRVVLDEA
jgi:hypothetical protein